MLEISQLPIALLAFAIPFVATLFFTLVLIRILTKRRMLVQDYHKRTRPLVPKPGGPALIAALIFGEVIVYLATNSADIFALILVTIITGGIGIADDLLTFGGILKPALLIFGSLPLLLLGTYSVHPEFPLFGSVRLSIIYPLILLIAIPVTSNTINTIDVLNGAVSGFIAIITIPLIFAMLIKGASIIALAALPLLATSLAFYFFHRFPSKIFPGDSGSLTLGAIYGGLAIVGGVEVVGIIALLPAILNSFFFLSSVRKLVEHRQIKDRPTRLLEGNRLAASRTGLAPVTLVRMLLADGPLKERQIVMEIFKLAIFSSVLAAITAVLTWGL
jgi:UDP-N-acetylmuramyl pentapeptide phosphotransferase/UDP-N-acetylglucosamine-1-phosphate transferase